MTSDHLIVNRSELAFPVFSLQGKEHHHLARVARIREGESVWLIDEEGAKYLARVEALGSRVLRAETAAICAVAAISQFWND